jgi:hypothetical protein
MLFYSHYNEADEQFSIEETMRKIVVILFFVSLAFPVQAQEFFVSGGASRHAISGTQKAQWSLSYLEGLGEHLAFSITYLNEGSQPDHHRDGLAPQIWGRIKPMGGQMSLALGMGLYGYCDTDLSPVGDAYLNAHGVGVISSVAATWYGKSPLLFQLRANYIATVESFDAFSATLGIGYQFDAPIVAGSVSRTSNGNTEAANNEVTAFLGATVPNNSRSEQAFSQSIEYRRRLSPSFDWTAAWLDEGNAPPVGRYGLTTQLWVARAFLEDQLALGVGAGPYFARDRHREDGSKSITAGMVSLTGSYRFHPEWALRITWNRVVTDYDLDADVFMGGLTYRF